MDDRETKSLPAVEPVAALKALMEEEAAQKYGTSRSATAASRSRTGADSLEHAAAWPGPCECAAPPKEGKETYDSNGCPRGPRCGTALGGEPKPAGAELDLEHALDVTEEVGIGPAADGGGGLDPWEGRRAKDWRLTGLEWNAIGAKPRFGARLRRYLDAPDGHPDGQPRGVYTEGVNTLDLDALADVIDQDAAEWKTERGRLAAALAEKDTEADNLRQQIADLRHKVEQLVEEMHLVLPSWRPASDDVVAVVEMEPFLERLAGIFGGREPVAELVTRFLRDVQELDPASPEAEDSIVISVGDLEIIAERYIWGRS